MKKRGRKKGGKNVAQPTNISCWIVTLKKPDEIDAFIKRGNDRQKADIVAVLKWLKIYDEELYDEVNGKEIMRRMK